MALPVKFPEANGVLKGEGCEDLHVLRYKNLSVSCWEFTDEELMEIIETGKIWATTWGHNPSPICISGSKPYE